MLPLKFESAGTSRGGMRIAILSSSHVASKYAATLIRRGHEVIIADDAFARDISDLAPFLECDGCLVLGQERALLEIAMQMGRAGKCIWRDLAEVPK